MERKILIATIVLAISITAAAIAGPPEILSVYGTAPKTARITVTDTSQLLSTAFAAAYSGTDPVWANVKAITISCENNDARISFGDAASQGASGVGHVIYARQAARFPSSGLAQKAYIINHTNGANAVLQVTVEF